MGAVLEVGAMATVDTGFSEEVPKLLNLLPNHMCLLPFFAGKEASFR